MYRFFLLLFLAATLFVVAGCGGGTTSAVGVATQSVTGSAATISAAQGAVLYAGATAGTVDSSQFAVGAQTGKRMGPLSGAESTVVQGTFGLKRTVSSGWTSISGTDLYYEVVIESPTKAQILVSTNGTTDNAGYIDVTLLKGGYGVYPLVALLSINLILDGQTITGTETLTEYDNSGGNYNIVGSVTSSKFGVTVNLDLTQTNDQVTGSLSVQKGSALLGFTIVSANAQGFVATFGVEGITGGVTVNPDGSGSAHATDKVGLWTLTWDAALNATLTAPDGLVTHGTLPNL